MNSLPALIFGFTVSSDPKDYRKNQALGSLGVSIVSCKKAASSQRPNLKPTSLKTPTSLNPNF
jgi:hypothetical protein